MVNYSQLETCKNDTNPFIHRIREKGLDSPLRTTGRYTLVSAAQQFAKVNNGMVDSVAILRKLK